MRNEPNMVERMLLKSERENAILRGALERIEMLVDGCGTCYRKDPISDIARDALLRAGRGELKQETGRTFLILEECSKPAPKQEESAWTPKGFLDLANKPTPKPEGRSCKNCARQLNGGAGPSDECVYCHHANEDNWIPQ